MVVDEVASVRAWVVVGSGVDVDVDAEAVVLTESLAVVAEAVVVAESTAGSLAWHAEAAARARRGSHEGGCGARGCAGGVVWVVMVPRAVAVARAGRRSRRAPFLAGVRIPI